MTVAAPEAGGSGCFREIVGKGGLVCLVRRRGRFVEMGIDCVAIEVKK